MEKHINKEKIISFKFLIKPKKKKKKPHLFKTLHISLVATTFLSLCSVLFTGVLLSYMQTRAQSLEDVETILEEPPYATEIYDRHGTLLYRLHGDFSNRDIVSINEINPQTIAAFMAAEDAWFYQHSGILEEAIIRCGIRQLSSEKKCGGSTITQQVIKLATNQNSPTFERKIDEMFLATELEKSRSKDEILELYFNWTPYGSNITSIKTAAKLYFGVEDLSQITLAQAVTLAAIINDPIKLAPSFDEEGNIIPNKDLEARRNQIFNQLFEKSLLIDGQLKENNKISDDLLTTERLNAAKSVNPIPKKPKTDIKAGHFVNYTIKKLQERLYNGEEPFTLDELQNGGLRIYTTLDYNLQKIAEKYAWQAGTEYQHWNVYNSAVTTAIPSTGEILTMAGSRNFNGQSQGCNEFGTECKFDPEVNILETLQSFGSTNKSLAYLLAFERGLSSPGSFLPDIPIFFDNYFPKNWDSGFYGVKDATARRMLRDSRNIPALILMNMIGVNSYIDRAEQLGYSSYQNRDNYGLSLVLGGGDGYPIEHLQAYASFANGGDLVELNPILKIEDRNGNALYEANPERIPVNDPAATFLLNSVLNNINTGAGRFLSWDGREVAGKTGTTESNESSLLLMYSPDFVTLGMVGNNNNDNLNQLYGWPAFVVAPWLIPYMEEITNASTYFDARTPFKRPSNVYWNGDWLISGREPNNRVEILTKEEEVVIGTDEDGNDIVETQTKTTYNLRMPDPSLQGFLDRYLNREE